MVHTPDSGGKFEPVSPAAEGNESNDGAVSQSQSEITDSD